MMESCTDIEVNTFEFKWKINKFLVFAERSERESVEILSSPFSGGENDDAIWHLRCQITFRPSNGTSRSNYVRFFAVCDNLGKKKHLWLKTASTYLKKNGEKYDERCEKYKITGKDNSAEIFSDSYALWERIITESGHDQLIFLCKFAVMNDIISPTRKCFVSRVVGTNSVNYLAHFLMNEKFSDVTFILGDEKIKAHKNILAARSPVFEVMFDHPMKEQNENEVIIDDIDVNVFKEMLRYIYTNEVPNLKNMAVELLYAADKYDVQQLKEKCGLSIWKKITLENAMEVLVFADRHNVKTLMELTQNFIVKHIFYIMKTAGYKNLEKEHPQLAIGILRTSLEQFQFE